MVELLDTWLSKVESKCVKLMTKALLEPVAKDLSQLKQAKERDERH